MTLKVAFLQCASTKHINFHCFPYFMIWFQGVQDIHFFWVAPIECALIMYLLYRDIGWAFVPCVIFIVVFVPIEMGLGRLFGHLR